MSGAIDISLKGMKTIEGELKKIAQIKDPELRENSLAAIKNEFVLAWDVAEGSENSAKDFNRVTRTETASDMRGQAQGVYGELFGPKYLEMSRLLEKLKSDQNILGLAGRNSNINPVYKIFVGLALLGSVASMLSVAGLHREMKSSQGSGLRTMQANASDWGSMASSAVYGSVVQKMHDDCRDAMAQAYALMQADNEVGFDMAENLTSSFSECKQFLQ